MTLGDLVNSRRAHLAAHVACAKALPSVDAVLVVEYRMVRRPGVRMTLSHATYSPAADNAIGALREASAAPLP